MVIYGKLIEWKEWELLDELKFWLFDGFKLKDTWMQTMGQGVYEILPWMKTFEAESKS